MHTASNQSSELANFTPPQTAEEALARIKQIYRAKRLESEVTMVAAQTKALETLMACMTPVSSTGDTKLDAFYARERNRQRLAAIQTLLHIRTVQREKRLRRAMRAKHKAKAQRLEPNRASDGSQATDQEMPSPPSPLAGEGGRASGRMRGRCESSDQPNNTTTCGANPSPQPSPARSVNRGEGAKPPPRKRSRYKTRKPKHPNHPRKRKR